MLFTHNSASRCRQERFRGGDRKSLHTVSAGVVFILILAGCTPEIPSAGSVNGAIQVNGTNLDDVEQGWGPERKFFTMGNRPVEPVFNSITDNPDIQDERSFLQIHQVGANSGTRTDDFALEPRKVYEGFITFHNDASLDSRTQLSRNTRITAQLPATVSSREHILAIVSSGTTEIPDVWRSLVLTVPADQPVALRIIPNSAILYTGQIPRGIPLPEADLFSERGALVGCNKADGVVTGSDDCRGYVRFQFVADQPNFSISQRVGASGSNKWGYPAELTAGQKIDYKVEYENTGTTKQNNVIIKDMLPPGSTYVSGSTQVATSTTNGQWTPIADNGVVERGINIGSYAPNGNAYVKFTAQLTSNEHLACGLNKMINEADAETNNGTKATKTTLWIERKC